MSTAIIPVYSIYTDMRNGYSVGVHKIRLLSTQLSANDTYTWSVPKLAPGTTVGAHLALVSQFPNLAGITASGTNRTTANAFVSVSTINSFYGRSKNPDGSIDLIYATIHAGSINNSVVST